MSNQNEEILKKKLVALKNAYLQVKEANSNLEKELADVKMKQQNDKNQFDNQEKLIINLNIEVEKLREKLINERLINDKNKKKFNTSNFQGQSNNYEESAVEVFTSIFGFSSNNQVQQEQKEPYKQEEEMRKLQSENFQLKKQNDSLLQKIQSLDSSAVVVSQDLKKNVETQNASIEKLNQEIHHKDVQHRVLQNDYRNTCQANIKLLEDVDNFEEQITELKNKNQTLENSIILQYQQINEKQLKIDQFQQQVEDFYFQKEDLNKKLLESQKQIDILEKQTKLFNLKKVHLGVSIPLQMILRQNICGDYIIECEQENERQVISAYDVTDLSPSKEIQNGFTLIFLNQNKQKQTQQFQSDENIGKIMKSLRKYLKQAQEHKDQSPQKPKQISHMQSKGFVKDIVSFFGN